jgi:hypothetical protein
MKKLLILFVIITGFLHESAVSQDCAFFKQGKDNNTGEPFKESRNVLVKTHAFQLRKEGASKLLCFMDITIIGSLTYTINPKDTLYLKLENYEVIKLVPDKEYAPKKIANMNGIVSKYLPYYKITKEILEKLAASPIVKVKVSFEKPIEGEPKKPEAQAIMKMAACMLVE